MIKKVFLVVLTGIFWYASAMAGNFYIGKISRSNNSEVLFSQSIDVDNVRIGKVNSKSKDSKEVVNERSGDPCGLLAKWGLVLDEWKNDNAKHEMSPAEILVLATEENDGNVVTMLAKMQIAQRLITDGQKWNGDFEYRLLESMSYGGNQADRYRWYGYAPNMVGESYQNALEESRGLTFKQTFLKSTDNQGDWHAFKQVYAICAWFINQHLGLQTTYRTIPSSSGFYHDFSVTSENRDKYVQAVQLFFEAVGSPLADKELFKKSGTSSIINYDASEKFCQCQ